MITEEINDELLAVAEKIKAKGWQTVRINIGIEYLVSLDLPPGPYDPRIIYHPSISATPHRPDGSFRGNGSSREYVRDGWDTKSLKRAIEKLHEGADAMPKMTDEAKRIDDIANKLTPEERRELGVHS